MKDIELLDKTYLNILETLKIMILLKYLLRDLFVREAEQCFHIIVNNLENNQNVRDLTSVSYKSVSEKHYL